MRHDDQTFILEIKAVMQDDMNNLSDTAIKT